MRAIESLAVDVGVMPACDALNFNRSRYYRHLQPETTPLPRPEPPLKLSPQERYAVHQQLVSDRFIDQAPASVFASLLDEGTYLCSERTMYRILDEQQEVRERRNQLRHPSYSKPELLATAPNQVWSWDITKLKGPVTWSYFYLYVILDIFSRYVVGWMVADREASTLATDLIGQSCEKQRIRRHQLILHADRGSSMKSKLVANLLADLSITKTHSRPHVSDDNPYSEAHFKTLKYRPEFPKRFGSIQDAKQFCRTFFTWYNCEHKHSGIAMLTPETVHYGRAEAVLEKRQLALSNAFKLIPKRFKGRMPVAASLPAAAWINKPATATEIDSEKAA
jgi:putative transposase